MLIYSARYFPAGDDGLGRYAGSLLAFAGAMLGLVLADNLILLLVFWELTGILSYLLIAHRTGKQSSRAAAAQALMVTTGGGMAMLVGAVLLGVHAGTFRISEILAHPPGGAATTVAVVLLIVGGISKSAIVPFHFWLPGAMSAPTPASAYLHAATMVKAGIYLFARFAPAFAALPFWPPTLLIGGGITMLYGGVLALRQRDLKLLLAYGTVSQLGLFTMLTGSGNPGALLAALAMLIGHATFKGALFFVVGSIDTCTGTRDLARLSGLGRRMPMLAAMAVAAAVSMAGLPPMIGFAAKEAGYAGLIAGPGGVTAALVAAAGSVLTTAYSARFIWGAFARKPGVTQTEPSPSSGWMTGPTAVLVGAGAILGVAPALLEELVQSFARTAGASPGGALALWHGPGLPLALSGVSLLGGATVYAGQRAVERRRRIAAPGTEAGAGYRFVTAGLDVVASRITALTQRGSLPVSLGAILVVLLAFPGTMLLRSRARPGAVAITAGPAQLALALVVVVLAVVTVRARRGLTAALLLGGVGYAIAVLYLLRGAPDLALTQILVETVSLVATLLVLTRLPDAALFASRRGNGVRLALALGVGTLMAALALIIPGSRVAQPVSVGLAGPAVRSGGGHNIVNVILVDIRGWDTFGEISVLVAAAVGVASLIFLVRRGGSAPRRPASATAIPPGRPSPWLTTNWAPRRSLLLEVATRLIFHIIVIFSLYVLFVGHDQPGGGFAAGLIVGIALTLRYIAGGAYELGEAAPVDSGVLMGAGLLLAAATAVGSLIGGGAALQSTIWQGDVPVLGHLHVVSSTLFDIGVYLVVIGMVLEVLRSFGAELDRQAVPQRARSGSRR